MNNGSMIVISCMATLQVLAVICSSISVVHYKEEISNLKQELAVAKAQLNANKQMLEFVYANQH